MTQCKQFAGRKWIKLWIDEWLEGTTRYMMSDAQRAFWIDLLAMAGKSRVPGVVCAGVDAKVLVGFPVSKFRALVGESLDVTKCLELFKEQGKIEVKVTHEIPEPLYAIKIIKWPHYQSEADRIKAYRDRVYGECTENVTSDVTPNVQKCNATEVEVEKENKTISSNRSGFDLSSEDVPEMVEIFEYYLSTFKKNPVAYSLTPKRKQQGISRFREALKKVKGDRTKAVYLMKCAIDAMDASDFHHGKNEQKKKYLDWELLFRSAEQFEKWLERSND